MRKLIVTIAILLLLGLTLAALLLFRGGELTPANEPSENSEFPSTGEAGGAPTDNDPFGGGAAALPSDSTQASTSESVTRPVGTGAVARRVHSPAVSATAIGTVLDVNLVIRYVDAETGNIFDYRPLGNETKRASATTIPRIKEVVWGNRGQSALVRFFDSETGALKNYLLRLSATSSGTVSGTFLPDDALSFAAAPPGDENMSCVPLLTKTILKGTNADAAQVRTLQAFLNLPQTGLYNEETISAVVQFQKSNSIDQTGNVGPLTRERMNALHCAREGGSVMGGRLVYSTPAEAIIVDFDNRVSGKIFTDDFGEWLVSWPQKNSLILSTPPASGVFGQAFTVPAKTGGAALFSLMTPLLTNVRGLTLQANPDMTMVIYSESKAGSLRSHVFDMQTGQTRDLPIDTFVKDKCVWSRKDTNVLYCGGPTERIGNEEPESWYAGATSYADSIYRINVESDTVETIFDGTGDPIDVKEIGISEDESFIHVINKRDSSLWVISLVKI